MAFSLPPSQVSLQQKEFLANGGEPGWIEGGIRSLPAKVLNFLTVNKLLAHQPWLVTPDHMKVHTYYMETLCTALSGLVLLMGLANGNRFSM